MIRALRQHPYQVASAQNGGMIQNTYQRDSTGKQVYKENNAHSGIIASMRPGSDRSRGYNHPSSMPHVQDKDKEEKGSMSKEKERRLIKEMIEKELFDTATDHEKSDEEKDDEQDV